MRNRTIAFFILLVYYSIEIHCQQPIPKVTQGKIEHIENFKSNYVQPRKIDIWLPNDYSSKSKYAVLYMHDGQMLFDPEITWNKQSWNADETAQFLISEKTVRNFIIVGIWNIDSTRHPDYFPQKPFESMSKNQRDSVSAQLKKVGRIKTDFHPNSDNYLKFITRELKPFIDKNYSVYKNRSKTFIAGSSMGGLISIYAICEYPNVFGGAACISTHWPGTFSLENNFFPQSMSNYLRKKLPDPKNHKVYFDCGDKTLDALYPNLQKSIDNIMQEKGFNSNNWITKFFPGENHSEKAWQKRLDIPFKFLLK